MSSLGTKTAGEKRLQLKIEFGSCASVVRHLLLPLMNSFNTTEAPVFHMQAMVT